MLQCSWSRGARSLQLSHVSGPVDTSMVCVLGEGIDPTVVGERCGPPKGCATAAYRLRARHSPGFVSPAGMSIMYGTSPFSAVQSMQVGGSADRRCRRASRRRALPVQGDSVGVSLICYREASRLLTGNGDASVGDGIGLLLADRWSAGRARARRVRGCPRTATTRSSRGPRTASG